MSEKEPWIPEFKVYPLLLQNPNPSKGPLYLPKYPGQNPGVLCGSSPFSSFFQERSVDLVDHTLFSWNTSNPLAYVSSATKELNRVAVWYGPWSYSISHLALDRRSLWTSVLRLSIESGGSPKAILHPLLPLSPLVSLWSQPPIPFSNQGSGPERSPFSSPVLLEYTFHMHAEGLSKTVNEILSLPCFADTGPHAENETWTPCPGLQSKGRPCAPHSPSISHPGLRSISSLGPLYSLSPLSRMRPLVLGSFPWGHSNLLT